MEQLDLIIKENKKLTQNVYLMKLNGLLKEPLLPGQFINISIPNFYLRRPISICDYENNIITIIYKVVGKGTEALSKMKVGEKVNVLTNLGKGFNTKLGNEYNSVLLIGGGVGIPPLYYLAKQLIKLGKTVKVILGFNTKNEIFFEEAFKALNIETIVTTVDGTYGNKGFVTDYINKSSYDYFYTCGPNPMLVNVYKVTKTNGEFSFEERMGCGFGACMGCSIKTKSGNKRVCKDGPVFLKGDIIWED